MSTAASDAPVLPAVTLDGAPVSPDAASRNHEAILKLTAEIFASDKIVVTNECDPEIAGKEYLVVSVHTQGEISELVAKNCQWHHRIWDVAPETASFYCLSLDLG
jgi:hypothetical protein